MRMEGWSGERSGEGGVGRVEWEGWSGERSGEGGVVRGVGRDGKNGREGKLEC